MPADSDAPGATSSKRVAWTLRLGMVWTVVLLSLTVVVALREATRHALPFYVLVS